jgi:hypothetical protein
MQEVVEIMQAMRSEKKYLTVPGLYLWNVEVIDLAYIP